MKKNILGFTLVELIVVITIVGILSTVGFVSYSGYLTGARDSNRFSQLTKLSDSLQTYAASKSLPLPDDYIEITASGASNVIAYQGYVGVDVLETIDYTNGGRDPKDDSFFTYYLTKDRNSIQLLTLMEEQSSIATLKNMNTTFAVDYSQRFPKVYGKKLGVLTEAETNIPVQELSSILNGSGYLDITNTTSQYTAYIGNSGDDIITGNGTQISKIVPNHNCGRIKQLGGSRGNGIYEISTRGKAVIQAYCDMENGGGGWTMVARSVAGGTSSLVWTSGSGNFNNLDDNYAASYHNQHNPTKVMIATYSSEREVEEFSISDITNPDNFTNGIYTLTTSGITGGTSGDGINGEHGMMFVK